MAIGGRETDAGGRSDAAAAGSPKGGTADDDELRRLEASVRWLQSESGARRLPPAANLPPVPGLPAFGAQLRADASPPPAAEIHHGAEVRQDEGANQAGPYGLDARRALPPRSAGRRPAGTLQKLLIASVFAAPPAYFIAKSHALPGFDFAAAAVGALEAQVVALLPTQKPSRSQLARLQQRVAAVPSSEPRATPAPEIAAEPADAKAGDASPAGAAPPAVAAPRLADVMSLPAEWPPPSPPRGDPRGFAGEAEEPNAISRAPAAATLRLFVVPILEVEPSEQTKLFWFVFSGGDDSTPGAHVLVKGLSAGVTLSSGEANAEGGWVVPLSEIEELEIKVSPSFSGKLTLDVAVVDGNGAVLDEHPVELTIKPAAAAAGRGPAADGVSPKEIATGAVPRPDKSEPAAAPLVDVKSAAAEAAAADAPSRPEAGGARQQEAAVTPAPPQRPPELVVAPVLDVEAAAETRLAVSVGGRPENLPPGTALRVTGLAGGVTLSDGQASADRGWVVPLRALEDLKIKVPPDTSGTLDLGIALVDLDGTVLADRSVAVHVRPRIAAVPGDAPTRQQTVAATPARAQALRLVEQQQAIADLDQAIRLNPNDAEAYNIRGNVWDDIGDADRALADYEQAIRIDPNNPGTFRDRGILWRRKGALDRALVDLDRAIRLSFSDAQTYSDRGLLWYEKGHHDRAIADFRRAAQIDPGFAIAYINRGVIVHRRRDNDPASPDLEQAIHVDPSVFDAIRREKLR